MRLFVITALTVFWTISIARPASDVDAAERILDPTFHHLRSGTSREWDDFPEQPEAAQQELGFEAQANQTEQTLQLRQQDLKQTWQVSLNGKSLGHLHRDENDMRVYFAVPPGTLIDGDNRLVIAQPKGPSDDVRIGDIRLDSRPVSAVLGECTVKVQVLDGENEQPLPSRITLVTGEGTLQSVDFDQCPQLAVRPGTIYTATGQTTFRVPGGDYVLYAGRGFEYSLASEEIHLQPGQTESVVLRIRREVPTPGYVACDTHVHTLTHSGHGDATVTERMVTIAAEGIELPIATDHNRHIDHRPFADAVGVQHWFTPVIGNEVTTPVGHFNIFPVPVDAEVPKHQLTDWKAIFEEISRTTHAPVVILNHARDLHSGVRPFDSKRFLSATGRSTDDWPQLMQGMEVVNSGATQTNVLQLFQDWMTLLNRGVTITPVGSSDSHDVARHFVGQGRTYIRCDDSHPGQIDLAEAVESFRRGRVMVSYGLLAEATIAGHSSGEIATVDSDDVTIQVLVLGPHWVTADRIELYFNGELIQQKTLVADDAPVAGVKWSGSWTVPKPQHDVHLVAIARGPGIRGAYWATAKPYQPASLRPVTHVLGCSGAIWLDGDGDGVVTPARSYAKRAWEGAEGDFAKVLTNLQGYDAAVAAQAAEYFHSAGHSLTTPEVQAALAKAAAPVQAGFARYLTAWRDHEIALVESAGKDR